jgi:hypothetical protein
LSAQPAPAAAVAKTAISDVLLSVADELERVRVLGLRIERTVIGLAMSPGVDASVIGELQQLDAILQQIAGLRDYAANIAKGCDAGHGVDPATALACVTLEDMRQRLAGVAPEDAEDGWEML